MNILKITEEDFKKFWPVFKDIVLEQETYAYDPSINFERAYNLWCNNTDRTFAVVEKNTVMASYYLKANGEGPASHVCNCGYMVAPAARGMGLARKLCEHSQLIAKELGYMAMQFNSVVSSNKIAVNLWKSMGFVILGTVPKAYQHRKLGLVDTYIMYKEL